MSSNLTKYPMDDTPISGHRVRIPVGIRDELGIEGVVRIRLPSFDKKFTATVDDQGRVTIPHNLREKFDIDGMNEIDIEILVGDDE